MSEEGFAGMLTISGCLWLAGQASHMVASYGQLTRKGESQWVNPMASLLRIMSQSRILSISHMEQQKTAWGSNNLDKNVNTCLFRRCFNCSVSSGRHRQVWKGSYAGCAHFSNFCTNSRVVAPAAAAPSLWSWLALKKREYDPAEVLCEYLWSYWPQGHVNLQAWMLLWLFKTVLGQASWHFFLYFKYKPPLLALRLWPQLFYLLHSFFLLFCSFTSSSITNWDIHWIHLI